MDDFGKKITEWFKENKRTLPWRDTSDPYIIWLSEIILQQTRVEQGLPYFNRFVQRYPTVKELAKASSDEVFKLWQGLGYYRRAANMMKTAQMISGSYKGVFPASYAGLLRLPGIGEYTAAAVASMAYGEKVAVVDGNVYRVLSRVFGIRTEIHASGAKKEFSEKMRSLMNEIHPGLFNEAVMEFGALQCKPANPACEKCIFKGQCYALKHRAVTKLPAVKPKKKKRKLVLYYLVTEWEGKVVLRYREEDDLWKGLYDFPSLEYDQEQDEQSLLKTAGKISFLSPEKIRRLSMESKAYRHQLTHIDITARFILIELAERPEMNDGSLRLVEKKNLNTLAVPKLVERFLKEKKLTD